MRKLPLLLLVLAALAGCTNPDGNAPRVSISAPAAGQTVSGTVAVQVVAQDESGIAKVTVFARGKGSPAKGVAVGSAATEPYVISWFTPALPNLADLELYAVAEDNTGNQGQSDVVAVRTSNANSPSLDYLVAFTYPPQPKAATAPESRGFLDVPDPAGVRAPAHASARKAAVVSPRPLAADRVYELEWAWPAVAGASYYGIFLSNSDLAGPYERLSLLLATPSGAQGYNKIVSAKPGDRFWGAVTPVANGAEGNFSNGDDATFLPAQQTASPADGSSVAGGRPALTWTATPGAVGYLYYVYPQYPKDATVQAVWKNYPQTTGELSAVYPGDKPPLTPGTYYWRVAAVSFNLAGKSDAYSFSEVKQFVVP